MTVTQQLSEIGFELVQVIKGDNKHGYPNDVYIYHRIIHENVAYQEVRVDQTANILAFENIWGKLETFRIWLGIGQATNTSHLEYKYYHKL